MIRRGESLPLSATSDLFALSLLSSFTSSLDEIQSVLKSAGFSQVKSIGQLEGQTFCQDPHCGDILVFPAQLKAQLYSTKLLSDHKLIIQVLGALRDEVSDNISLLSEYSNIAVESL